MTCASTCSAIDSRIDRYLERQRALGRAYRAEEVVLRSLSRSVAMTGSPDLDLFSFERWCASHQGLSGNVRRNRQRVVRNWCLYRQRTEPLCFVPDASRFPRRNPYQAPTIIAPEQIGRMLVACDAVRPTVDSSLRPQVLRLATVLLYTAGLRRGELLRLQVGDVNPRGGVLKILESKFHKSRWVPLSRDACDELRRYLQHRQRRWGAAQPCDPLLCHGTGRCAGYTGTGLSRGLHEVMDAAGVRGWDGRCPRIHDMRHNSGSRIIPGAGSWSSACGVVARPVLEVALDFSALFGSPLRPGLLPYPEGDGRCCSLSKQLQMTKCPA